MSAPGPLIVDLEGDLSLTPADQARLQHPLVGGVILFARNHQDLARLRALIEEIKALRTPSLLVAVDQEGGRVQRFRDGFTRLPPAAVFGRLYDADPEEGTRLARHAGLVMASELTACGVDLSFAPVLDVLSRDSHVIGDRAFHTDPEAVSRLAAACLDGMGDAGMGGVGKHFPGHGGVGADSHVSLPDDDRSLAALRDCDLRPFAALAGLLKGVMLAHVRYRAIEPRIPSYSSFWIRDVLRAELGFKGAVVSDDLSMAGAGDAPLVERCRAALAAGCQLLPVCNDLTAVDALLGGTDTAWPENGAADAVSALHARPASVTDEALSAAREAVARAAVSAV